MTDGIRKAPKVALVAALAMFASFLLAAWSFNQARRSACDSRNVTAKLFRDVIVIATTPAKGGKPETAAQKKAVADFRLRVDTRVNLIRC